MKEISAADIILEMRKRARLYMLSVLVIILVGFGGTFLLLAFLRGALGAGSSRMLVAVGFPAGLLLTVGAAWMAVFHFLRCPRCDRLVVWQFSMNTSIFAAKASRNCPGCGAELFNPRFSRRAFRIILILAAIGVLAGFLLQMLTHRKMESRPASIPYENVKSK